MPHFLSVLSDGQFHGKQEQLAGDILGRRIEGDRFMTLSLGIGILFLTCVSAGAQSLLVNPGRFGAMTCQQLWYTEQEVLAEGRVCLATERARRAFRRADQCISDDEAILPEKTQDYLQTLRKAARGKGCSGF
jgi:hypothetical protein